MKKIILASTFIILMSASGVMAKNAVFDSYTKEASDIQKIDISPVKADSQSEIKGLVNKTSEQMGAIQNENFEAAIKSLDAAQVEIREELVQYTQKYNDAKARYDVAKEECRALRSNIRAIKRKIKNIEKTKTNINKNMIKYYE